MRYLTEKRPQHCFLVCALFLLCLQIWQLPAVGVQQQKETKHPVKLETIEYLVKRHIDPATIVGEIRQRGIGFPVDESTLQRLQKLGANTTVIDALKEFQEPEKNREKKVTILVADFTPVDAPKRPLTETLMERLRSATKEYSDITIGSLPDSVTVQLGDDYAKQKGRERGADIVIWGWYTGTDESLRVNVHFEVIGGPHNLVLMQNAKTFDVPVSEFKSFDIQIQTPLSGEMSYLTLVALGMARAQAMDFDGAIAILTKVISLPSRPDTMVDPAEIYFYRGALYMAKTYLFLEDETERAEDDFQRVITLQPENASAYKMLGVIFQQKGDLDAALQYFDKAVRFAPDDAEALLKRGSLYTAKLLKELAGKDFNRALELLDKEADYEATLGLRIQIHIQMQNYAQAESEINEALKGESDPDAVAFDRFFKALIYLQSNRNQDVVSEAKEVLKANPKLVITYVLRAAAYSELRQFREALEDVTYLIKLRPSSAMAFSLRAEIYKDKGDWKESIKDYDRAIESDPRMGDAYLGRGQAYLGLGNYQRAIADFDQAILYPDSQKTAFMRRGAAHSLSGQPDEALLDYGEYIKLAPSEEEGYSSRANVYMTKGEYDKALADCNKALELNSKDADLYLSRGSVYEKKGMLDAARGDYAHAIELKPDSENYSARGIVYMNHKDYGAAVSDFDRAITMDSKNSSAWLFRGITYAMRGEKGDFDRAVANYTEYIRQTPPGYFSYARRASAYKSLGKFELALKDYSKAIALQSDIAGLYLERADIYEKLKDLGNAISDYTKAVQISPSSVFYNKRGWLHFDNKNWNEAVSDFQNAYKLDPGNIDSLLNLGLTYEAKGNFAEALTILAKCTTLKPEDYRSYLYRANVYKQQSDWPNALLDYDTAIKIKPNDGALYLDRGVTYEKSDNYQRAIADYDRAIELSSQDPKYFFSRASAQLKLKHYELAVSDLDKAIGLNPQDAVYRYYRGVAKNNQKRFDLAIVDLTSALRMRPKWDWALFVRGLAYAGLGDHPHATRDVRECLRVTVNDELRKQAQATLERFAAGGYQPSVINVH